MHEYSNLHQRKVERKSAHKRLELRDLLQHVGGGAVDIQC